MAAGRGTLIIDFELRDQKAVQRTFISLSSHWKWFGASSDVDVFSRSNLRFLTSSRLFEHMDDNLFLYTVRALVWRNSLWLNSAFWFLWNRKLLIPIFCLESLREYGIWRIPRAEADAIVIFVIKESCQFRLDYCIYYPPPDVCENFGDVFLLLFTHLHKIFYALRNFLKW